jgi:hypothetical protein
MGGVMGQRGIRIESRAPRIDPSPGVSAQIFTSADYETELAGLPEGIRRMLSLENASQVLASPSTEARSCPSIIRVAVKNALAFPLILPWLDSVHLRRATPPIHSPDFCRLGLPGQELPLPLHPKFSLPTTTYTRG